MDAEGNVVGEGDTKVQAETVLENVKAALEAAGGGMEDIKVTFLAHVYTECKATSEEMKAGPTRLRLIENSHIAT